MPYITIVLFFIATNFLLFNTTRQLLSRNYPIDIRDALCRPGKTISVCAFDNNCFEILNCPCFSLNLLFGCLVAAPLVQHNLAYYEHILCLVSSSSGG